MMRLAAWFAASALGRGIILALMIIAGLIWGRARTRADAVATDRATGYAETRKRIDAADIHTDADDAREWLFTRDPGKP